MPTFPYKFIAIEGNIGTGKTTLCRRLQADFEADLILEQFTDNPFLPFFYKEPERYGFPVELFFMTERYKQLSSFFAEPNIFNPQIFSDYFFIKTLLFAGNNLNEEEYRLFHRLFSILNKEIPQPDIIFYLHRPIENLMANITKRARGMEVTIQPDYLLNIQNAYMDYFKNIVDFPVVILELSNMDFVDNKQDYALILEYMQQTYPPGLTHVGLKVG